MRLLICKRQLCLAAALIGVSVTPVWGQDPPQPPRRARRTHVVEVVERTRDSVVSISSTQMVTARRPSIFGFFFDQIFEFPNTTSGSGFVIHQDGYIVTNDHVAARSADHRVRFADGREYEAEHIASDSRHDLAILKIEPDHPLLPLKLGRSDDIMIGEEAIAIGNPFGLENTVTRGVISALHRTLEFSEDVVYRDLIQTDASINPGNSGGPLLNALGELIGINTAIRPEAENVGFAIPVDQLRELLPEILDITRLKQVQFGMRVAGDRAEVTALEDDSPADKAGIRLGDVVTELDGTPVRRDVDFYIAMLGHGVGDRVPMNLLRDGKSVRATVRLAEVPKPDAETIVWNKLGLRLKEMNRSGAEQFNLRHRAGLVVVGVDQRGPPGRRGIRKGDLLVQVGRYRAWPLQGVTLLAEDLRSGDELYIEFLRFYRSRPTERYRQWLTAR